MGKKSESKSEKPKTRGPNNNQSMRKMGKKKKN